MALEMPSLFNSPPLDESGAKITDWKSLVDNGTTIIKSSSLASTTTTTVYTVTAGKSLYIFNVWLMCSASAGTDADGYIQISGGAFMNIVAREITTSGTPTTHSINKDLVIPIRLTGGTTITLGQVSGGVVRGGIMGVEI